jgi:hypothetical protein
MNENYRIIRNSKYRFDIVGSEYILPKLAEVILYLINTVIYFLEFLLFNQNQNGRI